MKIKLAVKGEQVSMPHEGMWVSKKVHANGFVFVLDASDKSADGFFITKKEILAALAELEKKQKEKQK